VTETGIWVVRVSLGQEDPGKLPGGEDIKTGPWEQTFTR
jgi:hypothetical protein